MPASDPDCLVGRTLPVGYCVTLMTRVPNEEADELPFHYAYVSDLAVAKAGSRSGPGHGPAGAMPRPWRAPRQANWLRISVLAKNTVAREVYGRYGFEEHLVTMEKPLK